jgi:CDP-glucose 4,6-dehydratase
VSSFWNNKNVLITGIYGFIGSNLTKSLVKLGANVIGITRTMHSNSLLHYEGIHNKVKLVSTDLNDLPALKGLIGENRVDHIFHLAAQVEVGIGLTNPYLTFESNTRATYTLLEATRLSGIKLSSIVIASTDKSYGSYPTDQMPYREDFPLLAKYPYDVSKACADMIAQSYASEIFNLPVVVTRFSNIYGPGQLNFSALFPDVIRSALGYSIFEPRGNGMQQRDYLFIDDVVDLYLRIGESLSNSSSELSGEIFNAGTGKPLTVKDAITKVNEHLNFEGYELILEKMSKKETIGEIDAQFMSHDKVTETFDWSPSTSLDKGIKDSIKWYKDYLKNFYD